MSLNLPAGSPIRPPAPLRPPNQPLRSHRFEKWIEYKQAPNEARIYYKKRIGKMVSDLEDHRGRVRAMQRLLGPSPKPLQYSELVARTMMAQLRHQKGIIEHSSTILPLFALDSTRNIENLKELRGRSDLIAHVQMHLNTWRRKNQQMPWFENVQRMRTQKRLSTPSTNLTTSDTEKMEQTLGTLRKLAEHLVVFKNSSTFYMHELFSQITRYQASEVEEQAPSLKGEENEMSEATHCVELLAQNTTILSLSSDSDVETDFEDDFDESYFDFL